AIPRLHGNGDPVDIGGCFHLAWRRRDPGGRVGKNSGETSGRSSVACPPPCRKAGGGATYAGKDSLEIPLPLTGRCTSRYRYSGGRYHRRVEPPAADCGLGFCRQKPPPAKWR